MTFEVYGIFDLSDPAHIRYVGLTEHGVVKRLDGHWKQADYTKRKLPIIYWMQKRTKDQVGIRVLESADDADHMKHLERFWIAQYRGLGMADLNVTSGGETATGYRFTAKQRARMSAARQGSGNAFYGKSHTEDAKRRMSEGHLLKFAIESPEERLSRIDKAGKLTTSDAIEIKRRLWKGATLSAVAAEFGVTFQNISKIKNGNTFAHAPWPIGPIPRPRGVRITG